MSVTDGLTRRLQDRRFSRLCIYSKKTLTFTSGFEDNFRNFHRCLCWLVSNRRFVILMRERAFGHFFFINNRKIFFSDENIETQNLILRLLK